MTTRMIFRFSKEVFFKAIRQGDINRIKKFKHKLPNLLMQYEDSSKMLPIQVAAYEGKLDIVKLFLKAGANPTQGNRPNRNQTHALYYAQKQGHIDVVQYIWTWLANHRNHTSEAQILCEAIKSEKISAVEELLYKNKSLVNATEFGEASGFPGGDPILHFAILNDSPKSVELLISNGANLESRCVRNRTPIQCALSFLVGFGPRLIDKIPEPKKRMEIVDILLKAGVQKDIWVESCLGNLTKVKAILEVDPDSLNRSVNSTQVSGGYGMDHYPLTGAVGGQHIDLVKYLLEQGADPNTPFQLVGYKHLDYGAPLEIATRIENIELVSLLLEHGANPNTSRHACNNAVGIAYSSGNETILELLLKKGGRKN